MNKFFRRQLWLFSGFFRKYYRVIIGSLVLSVLLGFTGLKLLRSIPAQKQTLRLAIIGQYTNQSLPPLVKNLLNSGLTQVGENQNIIGNLAEKWAIQNDGKTYIFTLKPNLFWSDGSPLKASDIAINIGNINVETKRDDQIIFNLPESFSPFPSALTSPTVNKKGLTASHYQISLTQNSNGLISKIELSNQDQVIIIKIYPNPSLALTAYKLGEVDAIYNYPLRYDSLDKYGFLTTTNSNNQALAIFFNYQNPILKDKGIRQGIAYAIKDKSFGFTRSLTPISTASWAYNPLVKTYDYDISRATKLIRDNLPDKAQVLSLELAAMPQFLEIAEKIKSQLDSNLINLNVKVVTSRPDNYQLYLSLFEIPPDPDQYIFWHSTQGTNISHVNNEKIDKDLEDGRRILDQNERKRIYNEFQRTFAEELPALFLYYPQYINLARNKSIFESIKPNLAL